jgi:hypothetical protein
LVRDREWPQRKSGDAVLVLSLAGGASLNQVNEFLPQGGPPILVGDSVVSSFDPIMACILACMTLYQDLVS